MKNWHRIAVLLLLVVIGLVGAAYTSGLLHNGARSTAQSPAFTLPSNPASAQLENGRVIVLSGFNGLDRNYGFRSGDIIPLRIVIAVDPSVMVNTDAILNKTLTADGSGMEFVGTPVRRHFWQNGMNIIVVDAQVRFTNLKPVITFQTSFQYATSKATDGQPNWTAAQTPPLKMSTSNTATDASTDMQDSDLSKQSAQQPPAVLPMRMLALLLLLFPLGYGVKATYRKLNPRQVTPLNARAWARFDKILADTDDGVSYAKAQQLAFTLRAYFHIESADRAKVRPTLEIFFAGNPKKFELARVAEEALKILDTALYERRTDVQTVALSKRQARDLIARIERLIPRP